MAKQRRKGNSRSKIPQQTKHLAFISLRVPVKGYFLRNPTLLLLQQLLQFVPSPFPKFLDPEKSDRKVSEASVPGVGSKMVLYCQGFFFPRRKCNYRCPQNELRSVSCCEKKRFTLPHMRKRSYLNTGRKKLQFISRTQTLHCYLYMFRLSLFRLHATR